MRKAVLRTRHRRSSHRAERHSRCRNSRSEVAAPWHGLFLQPRVAPREFPRRERVRAFARPPDRGRTRSASPPILLPPYEPVGIFLIFVGETIAAIRHLKRPLPEHSNSASYPHRY